MAYPTVDKPYGLKPVNLIGGQVFAGATRQMEIATAANVGYGTSIFYGDLVTRVTGGTIEKDTGTTTAEPCGVFLGCTFTNSSTGQVQFQQFYPASTVHVHQALRFLLMLLMILTRCSKLLLYLVQPLSLVSVLPPLEVMQRWCKTRVAPRQVTLP
jgi:hypothetical protein